MENTKRFSERVANYIKYRPGYPSGILLFLESMLGLQPESEIADIGSGTGKSAEMFLEAGYSVTGVEPNQEMRLAGEHLLAGFQKFTSVNGTAENTTLKDNLFDFVIAGQAFHWFNAQLAKKEFKRIKKENGYVVLIWNERGTESPFLEAYETFLKLFSTDYQEVNHRNIDKMVFDNFFGEEQYNLESFDNHQDFDFESLLGRYLSSSYAYTESHPEFGKAVEELKRIFEQNQQSGKVRFAYQTTLYYGKM